MTLRPALQILGQTRGREMDFLVGLRNGPEVNPQSRCSRVWAPGSPELSMMKTVKGQRGWW